MVHEAHERARGVGKVEGHHQPLIKTKFGLKSGLPLVSFLHADLMVSALQVDLGEDGGAMELI